mmetsp:Transcript_23805/g.51771  ORF Transcript_23805/g.51771 Transcript_23805/m.51771 type:complete len:204 (+) Transcript_23805:355-966(+)
MPNVGKLNVVRFVDGKILNERSDTCRLAAHYGWFGTVRTAFEGVRWRRGFVDAVAGTGEGGLVVQSASYALRLDLVEAVGCRIKIGKAPGKHIVLIGSLHQIVQPQNNIIHHQSHTPRPQVRQTKPGQHPMSRPLPTEAAVTPRGPQISLGHTQHIRCLIVVIPINLIGGGAVGTYAQIHGRLALGSDSPGVGTRPQYGIWII